MAYTQKQVAELQAERTDDPVGRGYAGMTDAQFQTAVTTADIQRIKNTITGSELFAQTDSAEYVLLTEAQKTQWLGLCAIDVLDVLNASSPAAPIVTDLFGNPSVTRTAVLAYREETVARYEELGLPFPTIGDVGRTV